MTAKEISNAVLRCLTVSVIFLHAARHACGHSCLVKLDVLHNFNEQLEREIRYNCHGTERRAEERRKKRKVNLSRSDIFKEAISKAHPSAKQRMSLAVLELQEGEVEYIECPVCLDAVGERDLALTPCAHKVKRFES